jgi:hypothetical protein
MTWREMHLSLQLAAEERAGYLMRQSQREAKALDDQMAGALRAAVS